MGLISKFLKFNGALLVGGTGVTVYTYPELRQEPQQLALAMFRGIRCAYAGTMMAREYINVSDWATLTSTVGQRDQQRDSLKGSLVDV
jgi:hypothetical protein